MQVEGEASRLAPPPVKLGELVPREGGVVPVARRALIGESKESKSRGAGAAGATMNWSPGWLELRLE